MNDRDLLRQPTGLSQGSTLGVFNVNVKTKNGDLVEDVAQYIDRDDMEVAKSQRPESPLQYDNPYYMNSKSRKKKQRTRQEAITLGGTGPATGRATTRLG